MLEKITKEGVLRALSGLTHPVSGADIVAEGLVQGVVVRDGKVGFFLEIDAEDKDACEALRQACEERVLSLGAEQVQVALTAHQSAPSVAGKRSPRKQTPAICEQMKTIIAVASGKGGVGKSTVAFGLARALAEQAEGRVGLLDADIYGPSLPSLLGITQKPEVGADKKIIPFDKHGILSMSLGFMVDAGQPLAWRGPMIQGALLQLFTHVSWQPLDYLIIDLPPGTGDIQLTLVQQIPLSGVVLVTTSQALSLADVRRCVALFEKVETPILGVVENMAWLTTSSGETLHPFGEGGGEALAKQMNLPYLGGLPLDSSLSDSPPASSLFGDLAKVIASHR